MFKIWLFVFLVSASCITFRGMGIQSLEIRVETHAKVRYFRLVAFRIIYNT